MNIGAPASQTQRVASAAYYDLSGRKVAEPKANGIYIVNGKKMMK